MMTWVIIGGVFLVAVAMVGFFVNRSRSEDDEYYYEDDEDSYYEEDWEYEDEESDEEEADEASDADEAEDEDADEASDSVILCLLALLGESSKPTPAERLTYRVYRPQKVEPIVEGSQFSRMGMGI